MENSLVRNILRLGEGLRENLREDLKARLKTASGSAANWGGMSRCKEETNQKCENSVEKNFRLMKKHIGKRQAPLFKYEHS